MVMLFVVIDEENVDVVIDDDDVDLPIDDIVVDVGIYGNDIDFRISSTAKMS